MGLTRRSLMRGVGLSTLAAVVPQGMNAAISPAGIVLPMVGQFDVPEHELCLNNARWHPMSKGARAAVEQHLAYKARGIWTPPDVASEQQRTVKESFARLIHATPEEIAYVTSTTAAENLIVAGLGLTHGNGDGANIVTDALHFEGSLYLYEELRKRGVDVRVVKPRDWRVEVPDLDRAINKKTKLVAISQVSYINGFDHDMKAVCEIAHAHGAYVYADMVQAAGCVPIDVRASNVDFCASASYKWLMGDFGLGFLYIRRDLIESFPRTQWSFRQFGEMQYHAFPGDAPGEYPMSYVQRKDAAGLFETGTYANAVIAALSYSLPWIESIGVEKIHAHGKLLTDRLQAELPRLGYEPLTPLDAKSSIATFTVKDHAATVKRLAERKIDVSLGENRMRISPSIYNTLGDVDALLEALRS